MTAIDTDVIIVGAGPAGDAAHQFPATGIGVNIGMLDVVNCIAWAAASGEPAGTTNSALREALRTWFGTPHA